MANAVIIFEDKNELEELIGKDPDKCTPEELQKLANECLVNIISPDDVQLGVYEITFKIA